VRNILDRQAVKLVSASTAAPPGTFYPRWLLALAFGLTLLTYVQVWRFDFVYDDHLQIEDNSKIRDWRHVGEYFTTTSAILIAPRITTVRCFCCGCG